MAPARSPHVVVGEGELMRFGRPVVVGLLMTTAMIVGLRQVTAHGALSWINGFVPDVQGTDRKQSDHQEAIPHPDRRSAAQFHLQGDRESEELAQDGFFIMSSYGFFIMSSYGFESRTVHPEIGIGC